MEVPWPPPEAQETDMRPSAREHSGKQPILSASLQQPRKFPVSFDSDGVLLGSSIQCQRTSIRWMLERRRCIHAVQPWSTIERKVQRIFLHVHMEIIIISCQAVQLVRLSGL